MRALNDLIPAACVQDKGTQCTLPGRKRCEQLMICTGIAIPSFKYPLYSIWVRGLYLVREEAVRDVLRGVLGCSVQGLISVRELVMGLIPLPQSQQDLIGLRHGGLGHLDWLETPAATCSMSMS